jgi:cytoskeletal protein RodZ
MSTSAKIILWLVIIVLVVLGVWWWFSPKSTGTNNSAASQATPSGPAVPSPAIVSTGTSDASLNQDLTNIDSELNGLSSDSAAVDQSLNQSTTAQ